MGSLGELDLQELVVDVMQPTLRKAPFSGDGWLFEPKWDGFRAMCYVQEGKVRFLSRNKRSLTEKFPELQSIASEVRAVGAPFWMVRWLDASKVGVAAKVGFLPQKSFRSVDKHA